MIYLDGIDLKSKYLTFCKDLLFDLVLEFPLVPVEPPDHLLLPLHLLV
jgi:hypothetical protein